MAEDDDFTNAFDGFGENPAPVTPPVDSVKEEPEEKPKEGDDANKDKPTDPADGAAKPGEEKPTASDGDKPIDPEEKSGEEKPAEPIVPADSVPQPLTKDDVKSVVSDLLNGERSSTRELDNTTKEVLEAFYPEGLSNVLIDEKSGKELRTPADVVAATNGDMSTEEAAQWLMNEQYKLDQAVSKIKDDARNIAETTVNFKRDAVAAVAKYEPLFKAYPTLQQKVYDKLMKQVKVDKDKGVILSSPDVMEHYDDYLEPYQQAYEFSTKEAATNPTPPATPEPAKPTAEDRMDESGDGGASAPNDPNDFAQQVTKELAKGSF